jgi:PAS domain S-box-containing protein
MRSEETGLRSAVARLPTIAGITVIILGVAVILGWAFDIETLKSIRPSLSSMKVNTAVCFILSGLSLTLSYTAVPTLRRHFVWAGALIAGTIAALTLVEYAFGRVLGIDQFFLRDLGRPGGAGQPGRMGVNTATCFVLLASSLLGLTVGSRRGRRLVEISTLGAALIAVLALLGYVYSVPSLTGLSSYTQMAIHTAIAFLVLSTGVLAGARGPVVSLLLSDGPGGVIARRLLPVILMVPPAVGWIRLAGQHAGLYDTELGVAIVVVSMMVLLGIAIVWNATALDRVELDRRAAAEALEVSMARLRHVLASSTAVIYSTDVVGQEFAPGWVSENVTELFGYEPSEALTPTWWVDHVHAEDRPDVLAALPSVLTEERLSLEYRFQHKDGSYRWVHDESRLLRRSAGRPPEVFGAWLDITEQKRLEGQFQHAQKMEVVGRLAGGVAHDFNNLLTVIIGVAELIQEDLPHGDPTRKEVAHILTAAHRGAGLTRQLLAFSRQQVLQPRAIDLTTVMAGTEQLLRRLVGEDVEVITRLDLRLGVVRMDPGHAEQIITNLAVNARDAMPDGGTLTISTANAEMDDTYVKGHSVAPPGRYVMISVSDTGTGMDEATKARLFEPYFTTKDVGKGTGLGLATAYAIVKQAGGFIWVYSELGRGTTFKIYIPRIDETVEPEETPAQRAALLGHETLLVVEDEAPVRAIVCKALEHHGYAVFEAPDAEEALRLASRLQGRVDLVLTDVIMPRVSGTQLGERLRQSWPDLSVVYMSGYTGDRLTQHGVLAPGTAYIEKPFTLDNLLKKVRGVLDQRE